MKKIIKKEEEPQLPNSKMYTPKEDSLFFAEFLKKYLAKLKSKKISYLDMGCGSGVLAEVAKNSGVGKILCVDIDKEAVEFAQKKGFDVLQSDLFSEISEDEKFDLITFNAPYLPEHEYDKGKDTTGGKKGDETSLGFLKQAFKHLNKDGKIFLLVSSHTPLLRIKKFKPKIVVKKKLFFEELFILEF